MRPIRERLRRLHGASAERQAAERESAIHAAPPGLREALLRHRERALRGRVVVELPPAGETANDRGTCYLRRLEYDLAFGHGARSLGLARAVDWERIAELAPGGVVPEGLEQCLFLDTETTGLGGGAGTLVFLCGFGFFEAERFVLEQVFLRAFAEEAAALAHVATRLAERPWLVTFVGKSFDRHRLAARMSLHRVDSGVLSDRHLDLYHLARRAFGKTLPDVRLRTVEERILGLRRTDDLPGSQAPWAFLEWIRDRTGPVDRVMEHNRLDVLSLVTLLAALGE